MESIHQEFQVRYRYAVHFTRHALRPENHILRDVLAPGAAGPARVHFVVDSGVAAHRPTLAGDIQHYCHVHRDRIHLAASPRVVPGGEEIKSGTKHVLTLQEDVERLGLCRHSYLVAIGGGAILDAAGYAAATAHRGLRLVRLPTTVLAQNDAGLGVKNGVNAFGKKNFVGTFAPPCAVINDFAFLSTLSDRDWRAGIAEAIKVALIRDAEFLADIERYAADLLHRDADAMERLIYRCAELHLEHIRTSGDPFEMGSARPLDFGHWAAHKLESLTQHRLRHGEAVAIGMAIDTTYSWLRGYLPRQEWKRVLRLLLNLGLLADLPANALQPGGCGADLLDGLREFREHLGGELTLTLLRGIGAGFEVHELDEEIMRQAVRVVREMRPAMAAATTTYVQTAPAA